MEIEIRRSAVITMLAATLVGGLGVVGYHASPRDEAGRPVLLMPDVRKVELYRREAAGWVSDWESLDVTLAQVLDDADAQLLARSRQAQRAFDQAVALARDVDGTEAPSALLGLHELSTETGNGYLQASAAVARWLSAPSGENRTAAEEALADASATLANLESNEWITATGGVTGE